MFNLSERYGRLVEEYSREIGVFGSLVIVACVFVYYSVGPDSYIGNLASGSMFLGFYGVILYTVGEETTPRIRVLMALLSCLLLVGIAYLIGEYSSSEALVRAARVDPLIRLQVTLFVWAVVVTFDMLVFGLPLAAYEWYLPDGTPEERVLGEDLGVDSE